MITSVVPENAGGLTVTKYMLRAYPMLPAFAMRQALKKKEVKICGKRVSTDETVWAGDTVQVYLDKKYEPAPLEIVYSDKNLMAFIKPAGLPVEKDADGIGDDTVYSRLEKVNENARPVHRLDTGTAGIMLASLNAETEEKLLKAFKEHKVNKHYLCIAVGRMPKKTQSLKAYLTKKADASRVYVSDEPARGAKVIETEYTCLSEKTVMGTYLSLLDVRIFTGRTHQIRAHLAHIGCPLLGDDKYGNRTVNKKLGANDIYLMCRKMALSDAEGLEKYNGMWFEGDEAEWEIMKS